MPGKIAVITMNYLTPANIIAIDDEPINNFITRSLLKKYYPGTVVNCLSSANEGIDFLQKMVKDGIEFPEYIFLDLNMSVNSGWDFLDSYTSNGFPAYAKTRIVILTSSVFRKDIDRAMALPIVYDFLSKPLSAENLTELFKP